MYVEITKSVSSGRGQIVPFSEVKNEPRGHELYISLFPFDQSIIDYVKIKGTIKEHTGKHFCPYIAFDIDSDDLNEAKSRALDLVNRFLEEYNLSPQDLSIYFTGSKGFHILLNGNTFGVPEPAENMGETIKRVALELSGPVKIDSVIYENHRLFRVENSLHSKTGLYKIQISYNELFSLTIDEIKEIAKRPRIYTRTKAVSDIRINEKINRIVRAAFLKSSEPEGIQKFEEGFFTAGDKGERNNKLYKQAFFLFVNTDLHEKSIREIVQSINNSGSDPLPLHEVTAIVNSARTHRKNSKQDEPLNLISIADLWGAFLESLRDEHNKIDLVFKKLNDHFRGKQRGRLGIILGYGGSKKSMFGQNACYDNIRAGNRCIYSNMEMGTATFAERFINIIFDGNTCLASTALEDAYRKGQNISGVVSRLNDELNDRLIVCENSNMTAARYDELITKVTNERGRVDLLIVDGMSMMGGNGTEVERANEHSKSLKELSKKWNILVLAITHASKGENLTTRDVIHKARGSEKIIDNADWIMTLSQIKQGSDYLPDSGIYHLWDKRGTGRRIESAWEFEPNKLRMRDSEMNYNQDEI